MKILMFHTLSVGHHGRWSRCISLSLTYILQSLAVKEMQWKMTSLTIFAEISIEIGNGFKDQISIILLNCGCTLPC